jgi:ParB family chromosome partitioning protein
MSAEAIQQIPLDQVVPHPGNRKVGGFDKEKLEQLAESIRAVGVQQPAVVRKAAENGKYELVAGERRWRAARLAGLEALPCVVRELDDVAVLKIQTIENLQREDVHPLDEAEGYARLIKLAKYDVETIAHELGKSISYVYQRLKLRDLAPAAPKAKRSAVKAPAKRVRPRKEHAA